MDNKLYEHLLIMQGKIDDNRQDSDDKMKTSDYGYLCLDYF